MGIGKHVKQSSESKLQIKFLVEFCAKQNPLKLNQRIYFIYFSIYAS